MGHLSTNFDPMTSAYMQQEKSIPLSIFSTLLPQTIFDYYPSFGMILEVLWFANLKVARLAKSVIWIYNGTCCRPWFVVLREGPRLKILTRAAKRRVTSRAAVSEGRARGGFLWSSESTSRWTIGLQNPELEIVFQSDIRLLRY